MSSILRDYQWQLCGFPSFSLSPQPPNLHPQPPLLHQLGRVGLPRDVTCLQQNYLAVKDAPVPQIGQKRGKEVFNGQGIS